MKRNRNLLRIKKLLMAALLLPMLQDAGCFVWDPEQFAAFTSSQFYQLWATGFQSGIGQLFDKWINNIY